MMVADVADRADEALAILDVEATLAWCDGTEAAVLRATATEAEGTPWAVDAELRPEVDTSPDELVGRRARLSLRHDSGSRAYEGVITSAELLWPTADRPASCRVRLEPALVLARLCNGWRRFLRQSFGEVVRELLDDAGLATGDDLRLGAVADRLAPDLTQPGQSNFDFLMWLIRRMGLTLTFPTTPDVPAVAEVVADTRHAGGELVDPFELATMTTHGGHSPPMVRVVRHRRVLSPGAAGVIRAGGEREVAVLEAVPPVEAKLHRWAMLTSDADGDAATLAGAAHADAEVAVAYANRLAPCPGWTMRVQAEFSGEHPEMPVPFGGEWRVSETSISFDGDRDAGSATLRLTALPRSARPAMPAVTPPRITTLQAARVVGRQPGQPDVDEAGRVLLRYDFEPRHDHVGDEARTPVSQAIAGDGWGSGGYPRPGDRVAVLFVDGDVERPVVVARLHDENRPTPELPGRLGVDHARPGETCGIVSRPLTPLGRSRPPHAILLSDRSGEEVLAIRARRRMIERVAGLRQSYVSGSDRATIGRELTRTAKRLISFVVGQAGLTLDDRARARLEGSRVALSAGATRLELDRDGTLRVDAKQIDLAAGASTIKLDASGVTVKGPLVRIN